MPAPDWLTYVGAVTGTIGTVTGIAGAVMGYKSYRRVSQLKALDLRLELRKQEVDTDEALRGLPALIKKSRESRFAVAAATGRLGSGAMDSFKNRIETDQAAVQALLGQLRPSADGYATLTHSELEDRLVQVHRLRRTVSEYTDKYGAELSADDKDRDHIRNDQRNRV